MGALDNIDSGAGRLDSRDIIARVAELEGLSSDPSLAAQEDLEELAALRELVADMGANGPADWRYGVSFIRDDKFEDHARELAEDIGAIEDAVHWPATCIDWGLAARELQMDYTAYEIDGETWWAR